MYYCVFSILNPMAFCKARKAFLTLNNFKIFVKRPFEAIAQKLFALVPKHEDLFRSYN